MNRGLILAAPSSGSGKTTITLGLLRALARKGVSVRGAKSGPDYIDPKFHEAACGQTCMNLDAWAMSSARIHDLAAGSGTLLIEGAMGLFDGAPPNGKGATADLARMLGLPVVLVVDAAKMAQSIAPLVQGFARYAPDVCVVGVILNNVGSDRHERMLRNALASTGLKIIGAVHREPGLSHPSRHLGLVQAEERSDLEPYLDRVANVVEGAIDLELLQDLAGKINSRQEAPMIPPPAQRIAVASDKAFAFAYPHILRDWKRSGAEVSFFSPLADEAPAPVDMVFLPGGYPELYAGQLAGNQVFLNGVRKAAATTKIYGECGGYMALGDMLEDAAGVQHKMLGLLPLATSFANRELHLGYRNLEPLAGHFAGRQLGHEFHYATTINATGKPLFKASDAEGTPLGDIGLTQGNVSGSFAHVIDAAV